MLEPRLRSCCGARSANRDPDATAIGNQRQRSWLLIPIRTPRRGRATRFRNHADYALSEPFQAGFEQLLEEGRRRCCTVTCSEAV